MLPRLSYPNSMLSYKIDFQIGEGDKLVKPVAPKPGSGREKLHNIYEGCQQLPAAERNMTLVSLTLITSIIFYFIL